MNQQWINKSGKNKCIIFFNGWGMDENAVMHLNYDNYDVCMFNNYTSLEPLNNDFKSYQVIILIAWSLGVWVAEKVIPQMKIKVHRSIAINGTTCPVHDHFGIPVNIFNLTLQEWNNSNRKKFDVRMMGGNQNATDYHRFLSDKTVEDQKTELLYIYNNLKNEQHPSIQWDEALIGRNDLIFPAKNQINWWTGKTKISQTSRPHFPFIGLTRWDQITMV